MQHRYMVDGSNYIFRAYYALNTLTSKQGQNTNAVYGFFRMIINLLIDNPLYFLIARDSPTPTLRKQQFDDYKANRTKAPDDLKTQIHMIHDIVQELRIPYSGTPGYEADDVLYSYAKYVTQQNLLTTVYSSDKDLKQLINEHTHIADPMKNEEWTKKKFIAHRGFAPPYIVDYLALIGDNSDNIPGVPGVGPKTAIQLIQTYQTVEQLYQALDEKKVTLSSNMQTKLEEGRHSAFLSKDLITLMQLPELEHYMTLDDMKRTINVSKREAIFIEQLGFKSFEKLLRKLDHSVTKAQQNSLF